MADFDNLFDAAIARADETIRGYMGTSATITSGEQSGAVIRGVFDDPENISYAGQGVRVEGSSPSLFVRTDEVRQLRRGDTLTIGEENFWVDGFRRMMAEVVISGLDGAYRLPLTVAAERGMYGHKRS